MTSTVDISEVEKFSRIADEWWDESGKFKPLHRFNPIRVSYIAEEISKAFTIDSKLKILDVGCGGGLISEPFAKMGASVSAIDASEKNISVAKIHAQQSGLTINYQSTSVEKMTEIDNYEKFDVVLALEVIEHVADVESFIKHCSKLVKPGGLLFIATINRTAKSLLFAKIGAEYVLRWLPAGTHDWKKFLKPSEINQYSDQLDLSLKELQGFNYNLIFDEWKISDDLNVNYIAKFSKGNS